MKKQAIFIIHVIILLIFLPVLSMILTETIIWKLLPPEETMPLSMDIFINFAAVILCILGGLVAIGGLLAPEKVRKRFIIKPIASCFYWAERTLSHLEKNVIRYFTFIVVVILYGTIHSLLMECISSSTMHIVYRTEYVICFIILLLILAAITSACEFEQKAAGESKIKRGSTEKEWESMRFVSYMFVTCVIGIIPFFIGFLYHTASVGAITGKMYGAKLAKLCLNEEEEEDPEDEEAEDEPMVVKKDGIWNRGKAPGPRPKGKIVPKSYRPTLGAGDYS